MTDGERKGGSSEKASDPPSRYLASATEDIQDVVPYEEEPYEEKSQEAQYVIDDYSAPPPRDDNYNPAFLKKTSSDSSGSMDLVVGASLAPSWRFMKLQYRDIRLFPTGIGFDGQAFLEGTLNDSIRWNIHAGYRQFSVSTQDSLCDREECFLSINYVIGGAGLKFNFTEKKSFKLWGSFWGDLMFPLGYDNEISVPMGDKVVRIEDDDFNLLHGAFGFSFGADIKVGKNLIVPLALEGHVIMLPTATVLAGAVGLRVGIGWKL